LEHLQTEIANFAGAWTPLVLVALFIISSLLILWRLESISNRGEKGAVLAALCLPYFSGLGNLIFVAVILNRDGPAEEVAINSWTNNVTSLCLLLAVPALIGGLNLDADSRAKKAQCESNRLRLSLSLSLVAMIFFSLTVWFLGQDGEIDRFDGFALVGLFALWQGFQVLEALKKNQKQKSGWEGVIVLDGLLILAASFITLLAVDGIVTAILTQEVGFFSGKRLGLLTGWLMVLPNAALAFFYAWKRRGDGVYRSQLGDSHICLPLCIGVFAMFKPMPLPELFHNGLLFLATVALVHLLCVVFIRGLPKLVAFSLVVIYGYALYIQL